MILSHIELKFVNKTRAERTVVLISLAVYRLTVTVVLMYIFLKSYHFTSV